MVREFCAEYDRVTIFSKIHNVASVRAMFSDLQNLQVVTGDDTFAELYVRMNKDSYTDYKKIGFEGLNPNLGTSFDYQCYQIAKIPHEKRWGLFKIPFSFQKPQGDVPYIFLHEDKERGFLIDRQTLPEGAQIIEPRKGDTIFGNISLILGATEIHCIDSSFLCLIDSCNELRCSGAKLYFHQYARYSDKFITPSLKGPWYAYAKQ
jgi:hypothetical protein